MARKATHKVSLYGVRCFMDDRSSELWGCNWFWGLLIHPAILFHMFLEFMKGVEEEGFPLVIIEEYPANGDKP